MATAFAAQLSQKLAPASPHVHWLLRLALASIFAIHGIDKMRGGVPPQGALDAMFFGSAAIFWLVALAETAAGIGIIAGGFTFSLADLATRLSGLVIAIVMLGAAFIVHLPKWNFMEGGAEFQMLTAAIGIYLFIRGNN